MKFHPFVVILLICISIVVAIPNRTTYRAAVVEYFPTIANSFSVTVPEAQRIMNLNVDEYEKFVVEAKLAGVELMVFPEYGLYGPNFPTKDMALPYMEMIPNADANPCKEQEYYPNLNITTRLSCLAMKHEMYLIVDMGDVQYCTRWDHSCPEDRRYQFNTQVVFGPNGQIKAKYYKTNLYFEPEFDVPVNQHPVSFQAFDTTFGLAICFDIMFAKPQLELIHREGITNLIYSSWWVNTPPLLTATQIQQGWSNTFGLNILASNAGRDLRSSGSGIFSNGKPLAAFMNPSMQHDSKLLIADVPILKPRLPSSTAQVYENAIRINPKSAARGELPLKLRYKVLRTWDTDSALLTEAISLDGLSCSFTYKVDHRKPGTNDTMLLYAADGYLVALFPALACGVARCHTNPEQCITLVQSPTQTLEANTFFSYVSLKGVYSDSAMVNRTVFPVAAKDQGQVYSENELQFNQSGGSFSYTTPLGSQNEASALLHIGYLGRQLDKGLPSQHFVTEISGSEI